MTEPTEKKKKTQIPRNPMPEQEPKVRAKNFDEVPFGYTPELAKLEASRCLQCKKPACVAGCPVSIDIPAFIWLILQEDAPDDYVIGTGESHSVREFVVESFAYAGLDWEKYVKIDPKYYRPTEAEFLLSDASKARTRLD
jgi:Fe-S oxidoreductase